MAKRRADDSGMFASAKLIDAFNRQVGNEMLASLQYVSIASYLSVQNLPELARTFYAQGDEEREHAMRFVRFIVDVGGQVRLPAVPAPKSDFRSAEQCVSLALEAEKEVTRQINDLVALARDESNTLALRFLDYFVTEQLEEVNKMTALLALLRRAGEDGLLYVEDYLSRRGVDVSS
ncbi:MAG TPA: ferritin [Thermoanaerobaculia bacterium]|nr:ferritin [Thermoanaerobaculia bacterium]